MAQARTVPLLLPLFPPHRRTPPFPAKPPLPNAVLLPAALKNRPPKQHALSPQKSPTCRRLTARPRKMPTPQPPPRRGAAGARLQKARPKPLKAARTARPRPNVLRPSARAKAAAAPRPKPTVLKPAQRQFRRRPHRKPRQPGRALRKHPISLPRPLPSAGAITRRAAAGRKKPRHP